MDIAELNDLRRRIANGGEYTDDEVAHAIATWRSQRRAKATTEKKPKKVVETISLDDML